jgi:hypothetical protein
MALETSGTKLPSGPEGRRSLVERITDVAATGYAFYLRYMGLGSDDETNVFVARQLLLQTGNRAREITRKLGL